MDRFSLLLLEPGEIYFEDFKAHTRIPFQFFFIVTDNFSDPDPCGSLLKWLPWIRIRIGNTDPDPGHSKWRPKWGKNLRFQVGKSSEL